ncbi:MAG: DnaJ domain [Pseudomonadota bacterium]|jgi:curved DNA-binding protein CbpA
MSRSKWNPAEAQEKDSVESSVSDILKLILSLSPEKLRSSQSLTGLKVIREAIDRLIAEASRSDASQFREPPESVRPNQTANGTSSFETSCEPEQNDSENLYWRAKRKTQNQRDEKKARLAKREELIRQLRNRVSESLRNDHLETSSQCDQAQSECNSVEVDRFADRMQRASFWPAGSVEWARQLLGIEMGMTESEKRQCYIDMVKLCHPDHNRQVSAEAIQMVNSAWELLR